MFSLSLTKKNEHLGKTKEAYSDKQNIQLLLAFFLLGVCLFSFGSDGMLMSD